MSLHLFSRAWQEITKLKNNYTIKSLNIIFHVFTALPGGPCWADCCKFLSVGWHPRRNHAYQILSRSRRGLRSYGSPKSRISYSFSNRSYNSVSHYRSTLWYIVLMYSSLLLLLVINQFTIIAILCWADFDLLNVLQKVTTLASPPQTDLRTTKASPPETELPTTTERQLSPPQTDLRTTKASPPETELPTTTERQLSTDTSLRIDSLLHSRAPACCKLLPRSQANSSAV